MFTFIEIIDGLTLRPFCRGNLPRVGGLGWSMSAESRAELWTGTEEETRAAIARMIELRRASGMISELEMRRTS